MTKRNKERYIQGEDTHDSLSGIYVYREPYSRTWHVRLDPKLLSGSKLTNARDLTRHDGSTVCFDTGKEYTSIDDYYIHFQLCLGSLLGLRPLLTKLLRNTPRVRKDRS